MSEEGGVTLYRVPKLIIQCEFLKVLVHNRVNKTKPTYRINIFVYIRSSWKFSIKLVIVLHYKQLKIGASTNSLSIAAQKYSENSFPDLEKLSHQALALEIQYNT